MAKTRKEKPAGREVNTANYDQHMIIKPVSDVLRENYMPYSMSVIMSRALPEIDGFKPSHRKLLYTMHLMGLKGTKTKSANIVGQTMKLNPHGDASIYETMVRLTTGNESLLLPLVESKGNMAKHYSRDMAYAAHRYTEAGLAKICKELFEGMNKNAVDMVDNYDGTMKEPVLLPVSFPNILVTPTMGIAVGMASQIASFNFREVCEATAAYIKNPKNTLFDIMPAPDFSTGGEILYDKAEMESIYNTGRGKVVIRSKYRVDKKNRVIEIYEIPYDTTAEAIVGKTLALMKAGTFKEINDIRDDTDKNGLVITIEYKAAADPDDIMKKMFKKTPAQCAFSCNFNLIVNGHPKVLGVYEILDEWVKFRVDCVRREKQFELNASKRTLHLLEGLAKILLNIKKAVNIIMNTEKDTDVVPNLMSSFKIDEEQAEYIAEIKLRNINKEYILNKTKDIEGLRNSIAELEKILSSDAEVKKIIVKKLQELAKNKDYVQERRSTIVYDYVEETGGTEYEIENYPVKVAITEHGYIKKMLTKGYREDTELRTKDDDQIIKVFDSENAADLLIFTDKGNVYKCRMNDIMTCKPSDLGEYANNIAGMEDDEKVLFITATADYKGNIVIAFENGKVAKYPIDVYSTKTNRRRLINAFCVKDNIVSIHHMAEDGYIEMTNNNKKKIVFNTSLLMLKTTKTTQGVQVMRLAKGRAVTSAITVDEITDKHKKFIVESVPSAGQGFRG